MTVSEITDKDVKLFKKVLDEMRIPLKEGGGGITIDGISALEYFKTHNLFEFDVDNTK